MKLNTTRPYGTITGHETAKFEQDGILFDGAGNQLGEYTSKPTSKPTSKAAESTFETLNERAVANAAEFLKNLLAGGPMDKSIVFKEAENNNQHWDTIKIAFAELKGKTSKMGQATLWSLNREVVR